MIPVLMSMLGSMGGSAAGGMGGAMGGSAMGGQAGSMMGGGGFNPMGAMPRGGYLDERTMDGQPFGGDIGGTNNMGFTVPQGQTANKDFMGVMQQGMDYGIPQMQQLQPIQDEPYGLMSYGQENHNQMPYRYGLMGY